MTIERPSQTALMTAAARAAHLIVDGEPRIHADTLAGSILGDVGNTLIGYHREYGTTSILAEIRTQTVCRARYTEDRVASGIREGIEQYVILGAGLDSFAYRGEPANRVRIFEVDQPATQRWKRQRLAAAGIPEPENLSYLPIDLAAGGLLMNLRKCGFDPRRPAIVSWLGVSMYLTEQAIADTLTEIGQLAPGSEAIMDYVLPEELRDAAATEHARLVSAAAAEQGEPWHTVLSPEAMAALLLKHGLTLVEQLGQDNMIDSSLWRRHDALRPTNGLWIARARIDA